MDSRWFKGLTDPDQKESREKEVRSYRNAFEDLSQLIEQLKETPKKADYDKASWSHYQADMNGANRMLNQILNIINLKD